MRKMRQSGINGIGSIPSDWNNKRVKYLSTSFSKGCGITKEDVLDDGDIQCIRYGEIYSKYDKSFVKTLSFTKKNKVFSPKFINYGDILFAGTGELVEEIGKNIVYLGQEQCLAGGDIIVMSHKQNPIFLNYALGCTCSQMQKSANKAKLKVVHISSTDIGNIIIAFPSLLEQKRIADFLDAKCTEIDALISNIQSEIETLEAYKKSVITEAVTKGLNKNAKLRDSKTTWLGKIPAHWETSRIGSIYVLRNVKVSDTDFQPLSVTMKGIVPQLDSAAKTNAHDDRKLVRKGDFVINSRSDRRGSCGVSPLDGSVSLINTVLSPLDEMNPEYYNWLFHTTEFADEFYKWGHGIVDDLWTTGWKDMKRILIPYPPMDEQKEIARHLNGICKKIDCIISQKTEQLSVLADYKKSIIYEYVTGKKEVPNG